MSEYMKARDEDGSGFLIETDDGTDFRIETVESPKPEAVKYFWMISADFSRELPHPVREYHEHGYTIKTHDTGMGFRGDVYTAKPGETVTRMGLLCLAIRELVASQNKSREASGKSGVFTDSNVIVKAFDCGRNEL